MILTEKRTPTKPRTEESQAKKMECAGPENELCSFHMLFLIYIIFEKSRWYLHRQMKTNSGRARQWSIIHPKKGKKYMLQMNNPWKLYAKGKNPDTEGHILLRFHLH